MIDIGLRSNDIACRYAAPLMIETGKALIVNISLLWCGELSFGTGLCAHR